MKCHGHHTMLPQPSAATPSCFPSPQALCTVNSSRTLLPPGFSCFPPKITSPTHCAVLLLLLEDCHRTRFSTTSVAVTYSADLSLPERPYTPPPPAPLHPPASVASAFLLSLLEEARGERSKAKASLLPPPSSSLPPLLRKVGLPLWWDSLTIAVGYQPPATTSSLKRKPNFFILKVPESRGRWAARCTESKKDR